jgi:hypothetical protein
MRSLTEVPEFVYVGRRRGRWNMYNACTADVAGKPCRSGTGAVSVEFATHIAPRPCPLLSGRCSFVEDQHSHGTCPPVHDALVPSTRTKTSSDNPFIANPVQHPASKNNKGPS